MTVTASICFEFSVLFPGNNDVLIKSIHVNLLVQYRSNLPHCLVGNVFKTVDLLEQKLSLSRKKKCQVFFHLKTNDILMKQSQLICHNLSPSTRNHPSLMSLQIV